MLIPFEILAILVTFVLGMLMRGRPRAKLYRAIRLPLRRFAQQRGRAVFAVGLFSFALNAGIGQLHPVVPRIHDEFSFLLAADTFAHGRLTNPTHPYWQHFETFHVIHEPSYQSKYPPGFPLFLALGQRLGGPEWGLWLCFATACAGVCWMLQAWLRPYWALVGGLLVATHSGMVLWWGQTYWAAGGLAMLGGALVYGALRRIIDRTRTRDTLIFCLGLLVLAHSRPYEGLAIALPAIGTLLVWIFLQRVHDWKQIVAKIVLPGLLGVATILGSLGAYNLAVTGNPLLFPYQLHEQTYSSAQLFWFQTPRLVPTPNHSVMRKFQLGWALQIHREQTNAVGVLKATNLKLLKWLFFFLRPPLLVPLFFLPWTLRDRWMRLALFAVLFEGLALFVETFMNQHYFAPATGLLFLLVTRSLQHLRAARWGEIRYGRMLFRGILMIVAISLCAEVRLYIRPPANKPTDVAIEKSHQRQNIIRRLHQSGGQHLVFVQYGREPHLFFEWVYNEADIDNATIVWARRMSPKKDQELRKFYQDRHAWILYADENPPRLKDFDTPSP